jgi:hypothetical protein
MDFLESIDKSYYFLVFGTIFIIGFIIVQKKNNLKLTLQYLLSSYGIVILLFSISIPYVFPGYPYEISDIENKKRLLYHLQRNNEAIVKTTETIRDLAFITFIFIAVVINKIIKHLKLDKSDE